MKTQIYESNKQLKMGISIWKEMFQELYDFRELTWRLFIRDLSAKHKQSVLGNIWAILMPFVVIGTFMFLNTSGILNIKYSTVPYPLYALIGLSIWQIFAIGLTSGSNSLIGAGDLITKISFPREILVITSMAQSVFEFLIKFGLIIIFFLIFNFTPSWKIILFPVLVLPIVFLTIGLSLILSLLNGVMRDTANVVSLLVMFLMFLTPVLYQVPEDKFVFFQYNFISPLITAPRDLVLTGQSSSMINYYISSVISLLIFLICWRAFHLVETKISERV